MNHCALAIVMSGLLLAGCVPPSETAAPSRALGASSPLGKGTVASFAEFDSAGVPKAIGIVFSEGAFDNLPAESSGGRHCFDADKDGKIDPATECARWHERVLPLPSEATRRPDMPWKWVLLNWNPHGHIPPGVYDKPHFDVHYYMQPIEDVMAIESGACGPEHVRCDQFARARLPLPAGQMHPDFKDVGAVAPAMGNHLVDPTAPEFNGVPFRRTWIYGVYDGRVTFYEEMVTLDYLKSQPDQCFPIKATPAVAVTGYYPTKSCIRYAKDKREYLVSVEDFQLRNASADK